MKTIPTALTQFVLLILLSFTLRNSYAQTDEIDTFQFRFSAFPLGIDIELADSKTKSFNLSAGIMANFSTVGNSDEGVGWAMGASPFVDFQYRWFYSFKHQLKRGVTLRSNSGNFFALRAKLASAPLLDITGQVIGEATVGSVWGFQRQYNNGFNFGGDFGIGYTVTSNNNAGFRPLINLKAGWILYNLR